MPPATPRPRGRRKCHCCSVEESSIWRNSCDGQETLCWSCGIEYRDGNMRLFMHPDTGVVSVKRPPRAILMRVIGFHPVNPNNPKSRMSWFHPITEVEQDFSHLVPADRSYVGSASVRGNGEGVRSNPQVAELLEVPLISRAEGGEGVNSNPQEEQLDPMQSGPHVQVEEGQGKPQTAEVDVVRTSPQAPAVVGGSQVQPRDAAGESRAPQQVVASEADAQPNDMPYKIQTQEQMVERDGESTWSTTSFIEVRSGALKRKKSRAKQTRRTMPSSAIRAEATSPANDEGEDGSHQENRTVNIGRGDKDNIRRPASENHSPAMRKGKSGAESHCDSSIIEVAVNFATPKGLASGSFSERDRSDQQKQADCDVAQTDGDAQGIGTGLALEGSKRLDAQRRMDSSLPEMQGHVGDQSAVVWPDCEGGQSVGDQQRHTSTFADDDQGQEDGAREDEGRANDDIHNEINEAERRYSNAGENEVVNALVEGDGLVRLDQDETTRPFTAAEAESPVFEESEICDGGAGEVKPVWRKSEPREAEAERSSAVFLESEHRSKEAEQDVEDTQEPTPRSRVKRRRRGLQKSKKKQRVSRFSVKAVYGKVIQRFLFPIEVTYDAFTMSIREGFGLQGEPRVVYRDEEGDNVTLASGVGMDALRHMVQNHDMQRVRLRVFEK